MMRCRALVLVVAVILPGWAGAGAEGIPNQPGGIFRDCPACPEMVVIPPGGFTMGSPSDEAERKVSEGPRHQVTIAAALAVGRYPVTRGEYARFVAETGREMTGECMSFTHDGARWDWSAEANWQHPDYQQTDRHPVVCVAWHDAKAYAEWLSKTTGKSYRLPSEAEWEYAARAGTQTRYWWGDDPDHSMQCQYINGADRSAKERFPEWLSARCDDHSVFTMPVDTFLPNPFGLNDMGGNVWQWLEDVWHGDYLGAPTDGSPWTAAGTSTTRVIRGGSWGSYPDWLRSALRYNFTPDGRSVNIGFRVARTLDR